jgi:transcriptional regulator with AAA-type ATPase domain
MDIGDKRAKANWAKSIAITTNAVLGSMNNRIIRTRIRHDASSTHDSAHPSASVQEMDAIHAAEPPSNPKTCYYIPTPKIPNFLGRDEQMKNLREQLDHIEASQERRIATLWGEGGIGKTQLALHYAEERKHSGVPFIFWISSENQAAVDRSFSTVAIELQLPGATGHGNHINNKYLVMQFLATLG